MQNRKISTNMTKELDLINKSRNTTAKALKNDSLCFRLKFSKHESTFSPTGTEATGVKMYETHTPGFCFHRDGQFRKSSIKSDSQNHNIIMKIYPFVFSHGEIDPEKIICMHLLTVQTLEMPSNLSSKKVISQAIFKSFEEEELNYENILPMYSLESRFNKLNSARGNSLKELKLINKRIELLINMIMKVLKETNEKKYLHIVELAKNKNEMLKLLTSHKSRTLFDSCERSTVLTDLRCYKTVNYESDTSPHYENIKKIKMPTKCSATERFIGIIRNQIMKEIQIVSQKNNSSQLLLETQNKNINLNENEFDDLSYEFLANMDLSGVAKNIVAESLLRDKRMSLYKMNKLTDSSHRIGTQKAGTNSVKEDKERFSAILKNMNNSQRIRVGQKVAELKSKLIHKGNEGKRIPLEAVFQEVLSKRSLEDLIQATSSEESGILLKPFEYNMTDKRGEKSEKGYEKHLKNETQLNSSFDHRQENNSNFIFVKIKQDIINKETNKKIKRFLSK